jgi:RHS repeat-associated protein
MASGYWRDLHSRRSDMATHSRFFVVFIVSLLSIGAGLAAPTASSDDFAASAVSALAVTDPSVTLPPLVNADTAQFGGIPGRFAVNDVGNATYHVPIDLPPGPNGMTPALAIKYDSSGSNGLLGMGFSLSGLSAISVCREERRHVDFRRTPRCLDGERLIAEPGGVGVESFHTEHFSQRRIWRFTPAGDPTNAYYEITDSDGTVHRYGDPADPRYRRAFTLPLTLSVDRFGNRIRYKWLGQEPQPGVVTVNSLLPGEISYGHQEQIKVTFAYESRPNDKSGGFFLGRLHRSNDRLKSITVARRAPADTQHKRVSALSFSYFSNEQVTQLKQIDRCGTDDTSCNLPTQFVYSRAVPYTYDLTPAHEQPVRVPGYEYDPDRRAWLHDATGDGFDDIVLSAGSISKGWYLLPNRGTSVLGYDPKKPFDRSIKVAEVTPTEVGGGLALDYDGNGTIDMLPFQSDGNVNPLLFDTNGSAQRASIPLEFQELLVSKKPGQTPAFDYNAIVAGDFTGDKVVDLMTYGFLGTSVQHNGSDTQNYAAHVNTVWKRADGKKEGGFELPYVFGHQVLVEYTSHNPPAPPWTPETLTHARRVMAINYDNGSSTSLLFNRNVCNDPPGFAPDCPSEPSYLDPFRGGGATTLFRSQANSWSDQLMSRGFVEFTVDEPPCTGCLYKEHVGGAAPNDVITFSTTIPANAKNLVARFEGPARSGPDNAINPSFWDTDLYVRRGAAPTATDYDCRPKLSPVLNVNYVTHTYTVAKTQKEACTFAAPAAGSWYVQVRPSSSSGLATPIQGVVPYLTLVLEYMVGGAFDFTAQRPVRWSKFPSLNTQAGEFPALDLSSRVVKQGDFNGDGQMDLIVDSPAGGGADTAAAKKKLWIWYNTGHELWDGSDITSEEGYSQRFLKPIAINYTPSSPYAFEHALVADMDDDGKQELVIPSRNSTAQGNPDPDLVNQLDVVDFPRSPNDIINVPTVGGRAASVAPFSPRTLNAASSTSTIYGRSPALIGDVNGDLKPDVIVTDVDNISNSHLKVYFGGATHTPAALLTEIREGPNNTTSSYDPPATHVISYASPKDAGIVSTTYPVCQNSPATVCGAPSNYVVEQVEHDTDSVSGAPRTETHSYATGRIDRASGRFLGFAFHNIETKSVDGYSLTVDHREFSNTLLEDDPRLLLQTVHRALADGKAHVTRTTNEWDIASTSIGTGALAYVRKRTVEQFEGPAISLGSPYLATTEEVKSLDTYGNTTKTESKDSHGFTTYTTVTLFPGDQDKWLLQRVKRTVVVDSSPQTKTAKARTTEYTYATNAAGEPTAAINSVTRFGSDAVPGLRHQVEVTSRDAFGNAVCTSSRDLATQVARSGGCVHYDPANGVYPYKSVDALGLTTWTYFDSRLGLPMVTIDPTGRRSEVQFDKLGRPVRRSGDGMLTSTTKYGFEKQPDSEMLVNIRTMMLGFQVNDVVLDRLGRSRFKRFRGLDGGTRESRSSYDAHGHLVAHSVPGPKTTPPHVYSEATYVYDNAGRIRSASFPGKGTTTYSYDGLQSTTTDANGNKTVTLRDTRGEVVQTRRGVGKPEETTWRYLYEAFGSLAIGSNVISPNVGKNVRELRWNEHGMLESSEDPEAGHTQYTYNGLLDLETRTNANGDVWRIESRDPLGRPVDTSVTRSSGLLRSRTHIDYVPANNAPADKSPGAISRITRTDFDTVVGGEQTSLEYFYDSLGRIKRQAYTVPGESAQTAETLGVDFEFDAAGRLWRLTYPKLAGQSAALAVEYRYDDLHDLSLREVVTYPGAEPLWRVDTSDYQNRPNQFTTGDGAVETNHFTIDGALDLVTIKAGSAAGDPYLSTMQFMYDAVGNLGARWRIAGPSTQGELFTYDALNRLQSGTVYNQLNPFTVTPTGAPLAIRTYDYDKFGNRLGGLREYDALRPTRLTKDVNGIALAYDAVGNVTHRATGLIADPVQDIAYNEMNLPTTITGAQGKVLARFLYGPGGEVLRTSRDTMHVDNVTTAFPGLYERVTPASTTSSIVHRFKVKAGGRDVAILSYDEARGSGALSAKPTVYPHYDHLGSVDIATHRAPGAAVAEMKTLRSYDAFGRLRSSWSDDSAVILTNASTRLGGFGGHEDEPNLGLVHMGGRVYDPMAERFLSVDPLAAPGANGYGYASNNPTSRIDPDGFEDEGADDGWAPPLALPTPPPQTGPNMSCWPGSCGSQGGESSYQTICDSRCRKYIQREERRRRDAQMRAEYQAAYLGHAIDLRGSKSDGATAPSIAQGASTSSFADAGVGGMSMGPNMSTEPDWDDENHHPMATSLGAGKTFNENLVDSAILVSAIPTLSVQTFWLGGAIRAGLTSQWVATGPARMVASGVTGGLTSGEFNAVSQWKRNGEINPRQLAFATGMGTAGSVLGTYLMAPGGKYAWDKGASLATNWGNFGKSQMYFLSFSQGSAVLANGINGKPLFSAGELKGSAYSYAGSTGRAAFFNWLGPRVPWLAVSTPGNQLVNSFLLSPLQSKAIQDLEKDFTPR